jgi:class 3 adenylate cyclase
MLQEAWRGEACGLEKRCGLNSDTVGEKGLAMETWIPANETERLATLRQYQILDTLPELAYDEIGELAAQICGCPAGLVTFLDETRQWMKAKYGLPPDLSACPREITICQATICNDDLLCVPDLTQDRRFQDSPLVTSGLKLRFYCGMPLISPDGHALGTLCVVDFEPREINFGQQEALRRLSRQVIAQLELRRKLIEREEVMRELDRLRAAAETAGQKSETMLLNILPRSIAQELREHDRVQPRFHDSVSILFVDFKDFTRLTESLDPASLVQQLDQFFSAFDEICLRCRLEKLKTMGDAYVSVGGLPEPNRTHAADAAIAALQIQDHMAKVNRQRERLRLPRWDARIGINTGPVIAGVVGRYKFTYDIWGNAVNVAERMESASEPGRINISATCWQHLRDRFDTEPRGQIDVKGKGLMPMYFLNRIKPEFSANDSGFAPSDSFWRPWS